MISLLCKTMQSPRRHRMIVALFLPWMVCWLTIFPLIHIHPEADHAHGHTHHHHGGLIHSVLSQDLPCEFGKDSQVSSSSKSKETFLAGVPMHGYGFTHPLTHVEITFSALKPPSDGPNKKHGVDSWDAVEQGSPVSCIPAWKHVYSPKQSWFSRTFIQPFFSRPPPVLLI